ncbi:hypothetical protein D0T50_07935 [Bacteroides sp. 214]|uniref:choice-of-anchor J domain-containing protein n=1 Tax=Bacteroides sp. 214 TaxID=2302935 RepID=UPI0013D0F67A|nr:choice-of-anchor J domain-containing protein [Bacteroides sp. 214]NDW12819.1 hypothetical protein [Bacteroides sp. 214]
MKKNIIVSLTLLALLSACNDDYNDQFDIDNKVTDVKSIAMTLSASDYAVIAGDATNLEIALSKDPEEGTGVDALKAVGANKYFTPEASAEEYIPAFIANKYPNADLASKFTVTYMQYQAPSGYLADFTNISTYQLTSEDYQTVWGDKVKASFLSPASVSKIPSLLTSNVNGAETGDMVVVNYAYSDVEPSIGGGSGTTEPTWTPVVSVPVRSAGKDWNYVNLGPIDLSEYKGQTINIGFKYTSTATAAATWELRNFKALKVPYLDVCIFNKQEDGSFKKLVKASEFSGAGDYVIATIGVNGEYYPFGRLAEGKTYGYMYPDPIVVTNGVIAADAAADFIITLEASTAGYNIKNVLGQYFYMSGTYDSFNVTETVGAEGYDWTVETAGNADVFTITNVEKNKSVKLNYYNGSYSYGSYAASKIEGYTYAANSLVNDEGGFTVYDVNIDGLSFVWKNVDIYGWKASAFVSSVNHATETYLVSPSIEITEDAVLPYFTIDEAFRYGAGDASDITIYISTDYVPAAGTRAMTRATVNANTSRLYRFDGTVWSEYTSNDAKITVVEPEVYASLGTSSISEPDQILPLYLSQKYPYALAGERATVVYNKSADKPAFIEFTKDAATWIVTPAAVEQVTTFTKDNDGITAKISVYMDESLLGSTGGFVAQDVKLVGGLSYVWQNTAAYGWKASSFYNNTNNPAESWLVSPALDFRKGTAPVITLEEAINYLNGANVEEYCGIKISTDYKDNVQNATWTPLIFPTRAEGTNWSFISVGEIDLSEYVGQIAHIAFVYMVPEGSTIAPTWEFMNILVKEKTEE